MIEKIEYSIILDQEILIKQKIISIANRKFFSFITSIYHYYSIKVSEK